MLPGSNPGWLGRKGEHFLCAQLSPFLTWARILHNDTYASLTEKEETESRNMLQILPPKKNRLLQKNEKLLLRFTPRLENYLLPGIGLSWLDTREWKKGAKSQGFSKIVRSRFESFFRCKSNPIEWENCWTIFSHLLCPPPLGIGWVPLKCSNISGCSTVVKHHSASQNTTRSWVPTSIG